MTTRFYSFSLTLQAPAIFTTLEGEPNSASTHPFVPGAALRGAIAAALSNNSESLTEETFRDLVLSGRVCCLNAYPVVGGRRTFPTPLSFRKEKYYDSYHDLATYSGAVTEDHYFDATSWPEESLVNFGSRFLTIGSADFFGADTDLTSSVHHQRDRSKGRAYRDSAGVAHGALFTYEAVQRQQEFGGCLVVTGQDADEVAARFSQIKQALDKTGNNVLWDVPAGLDTAARALSPGLRTPWKGKPPNWRV